MICSKQMTDSVRAHISAVASEVCSHVHEESKGILHVFRHKEVVIGVFRVRMGLTELLISCIHLLKPCVCLFRLVWILIRMPAMGVWR